MIEDMNDNVPLFEQSDVNNVTLAPNVAPVYQIMKLSAHDAAEIDI